MSLAQEILSAIQAAPMSVTYFGLRIEDGRTFPVGHYVPNSRVWDDGEPTDDEVNGVSTVGLGDDVSLDDVENALHQAEAYHGDTIVLVGGKCREHGQDSGEHILRAAVSLGSWSRPEKSAPGAHAYYR